MIHDLTIEYRICRNNLGDCSDEFAEKYEDELHDAIVEEYPDDSEVEVNLDSSFANADEVIVNGYGDKSDGDAIGTIRERLKVIAGEVWNRMN